MFDYYTYLLTKQTAADLNEGLVGMASVLIVLILSSTVWGMFS
jgi:hypothetical protein